MEKLYKKSEIWFAVTWIIAYVVLASTGDNISAESDIQLNDIIFLCIISIKTQLQTQKNLSSLTRHKRFLLLSH